MALKRRFNFSELFTKVRLKFTLLPDSALN